MTLEWLSAVPLWGWVLLATTSCFAGGGLTVLLVWRRWGPEFPSTASRDARAPRSQPADDVDPLVADGGEPLPADIGERDVRLEPPRIRSVNVSLLRELYRWMVWRWNRKRLVKDGYIQWFLLNGTWPTPRFIKPQRDGAGQLYTVVDGERYLFPERALVPDEQQGAWTAVHRKGDSEPINPNDHDELAIPADALQDYATRTVLSEEPGAAAWMSKKALVYGALGLTFVIVAIAYMMQMGLI